MRSFFLLLLGGTAGIIIGVLLVTIDSFPGGGSADPNDPAVVGIGTAGAWLTEGAIKDLIEQEAAVTSAGVRIEPDGLIYIDLLPTPQAPELPTSLVLNPGVDNGVFVLTPESWEGGTLPGTAELVTLMVSEVRAFLEPVGGRLAFRLTAIATTNNRLTLEIEVIDD